MATQIKIQVTTLNTEEIVLDLPDLLQQDGYRDEPIECFMEHPKGFGSLVHYLLVDGSQYSEQYPRLSRVLCELRGRIVGFGIPASRLKDIRVSEEPNTVILSLE
jgi:hypothetical protein